MNPAVEARAVPAGAEVKARSAIYLGQEVRTRWAYRAPSPDLPRAGSAFRRRALNVIAAAVLLLLAAPLMVVLALAVKLTSPGPVIYRQTRVGIDRRRGGSAHAERRRVDYGGKLFTILKFRTMRWEADCTVEQWARPNDPRLTPVGAFLRKYRLDELPQLFNVLRGDMNVVGPRPEQPRLFAEIGEHIPEYRHRQRVLPGITGWAQVNHGYDGSIDDVRRKLLYDLAYLRRQSTRLDLVILLRTVPVVLFRRGAV